MLFPDVIRATVAAHPDVVAVRHGDATLTYAELFERSSRLATALRDLGVDKGDRVAFLGDNRLESVEHIVGTALGGFVRATLYSYYSADTNAYLVDHIGATALVVDAAKLPDITGFLAARPDLTVVVIGADAATEAAPGHHRYEDLLAAGSPTDPAVAIDPDDLLQIRFSSGTSGRPKGICHSYARWGAADDLFRAATPEMTVGDVYMCPGSLAHIAIGMIWSALRAGATVLPLSRFDAGEALDLIERWGVTHAPVVPAMIAAMVEHPSLSQRDVSSVRCLLYAGSPIAPKTLARALDAFGRAPFQFFGQSEVVPVTMLTGDDHADVSSPNHQQRLRSTGRAVDGVEVDIVDDDGAVLPAGEIGEIVVRSPSTMSFLWDDPEATAARTLPDGAVRTRDMGYVDADGYLFVVDRKDDMIISGGYNIWPAEIETALLEHDDVADTVVIGIPHPRWGETPLAFVVARAGATPSADELVEFAAQRVGRVKKPTAIEFLDALPRSDNGKVQRTTLRAPYWTGTSRIQGS